MIENRRFLPMSGRRYVVTDYGTIECNGVELPTYEKDGHICVDLDWVLGRQTYRVAVLILVAHGRLKLPDHLYGEVEPLYKDQIITNLAPVNVFYRFRNGPLAVEEIPGFYYIPMFTNYAISREGRLMNIETRTEKVWSTTLGGGPKNQTGGYSYNRSITDEGKSVTLFRHRALCMVFKPYGYNVYELVVNHKDGRPWNDDLDNLEWVTYSENNRHAINTGLKNTNSIPVVPILMKNLATGEIKHFSSISECSRHTGTLGVSFIQRRLRECPNRVFPDLLMFKLDDGSEWPKIDMNRLEIVRAGFASEIVARNVFTGELVVFMGCPAGAQLTGVKTATIHRHVSRNSVIPISGWNFRYREFASDWPQHSARHLQIFKDSPIFPRDGVIATDAETGEELFFTSSRKAAQEFKMSKEAFWSAIRHKTLVRKKYRLSIFKLV